MNEENFKNLKVHYSKYLKASEDAMDIFDDKALCFHKCTLQLQKKEFLSDSHIEQIYRTLRTWGMHQLKGREEFSKSVAEIIQKNKNTKRLLKLKIEELEEKEFEKVLKVLTEICFKIDVTDTETKIVAATKTLAHIFPNLVPPMDRQYTKKFFGCYWDYKNDSERKLKKQIEMFQDVMKAMKDFYSDKKIVAAAKELVKNNKKANTSLPKVFDNLIITYMNEYKNK